MSQSQSLFQVMWLTDSAAADVTVSALAHHVTDSPACQCLSPSLPLSGEARPSYVSHLSHVKKMIK